ncbi:uncharacterized protein B0I36DRAFT_314417 [Microdochium trichocladiopsis]|uniref:Uncharacterized protein n=1 Tax=Microdochium trichocladiopsis TaxID=1682393 RepID=A0A9P9BUL6_9PEZI|nr:uncharacterized protein B0I36DRAFT_314417 [Microdochium trichocladiopsis]KAH7037604.1 hypothetical protein B0I36DRAFT_314417 [Microdochium trichocladiopsis]
MPPARCPSLWTLSSAPSASVPSRKQAPPPKSAATPTRVFRRRLNCPVSCALISWQGSQP